MLGWAEVLPFILPPRSPRPEARNGPGGPDAGAKIGAHEVRGFGPMWTACLTTEGGC